jgi:seryl-tRNA synthetase
MLDANQLRTALAETAARLKEARGFELDVPAIQALESERRALQARTQELQNKRNTSSKAIGMAKAKGEDASKLMAEVAGVGEELKGWEARLDEIRGELDAIALGVPNIPQADVPVGRDENDNLEVKRVGTPREFDFEVRDHMALGERNGWLDTETGAKLSGSRFAYLRGDLVFLELALVQWALSKLRDKGHEAVIPPVLVREDALYGTGFLPDTEQQIYALPGDDLYLVGTSEVALASMHAGEILEVAELPLRYAGFSPCFRREAGAAGASDRGLFRVHQFDKVEMFSFVPPEDAEAEHARLLAIEEEILTELGIPYQVVDIAVDDLGASAARKFDCEAWLPSQQQYRELTSTSNTTDFQARRLGTRLKDSRAESARKPEPLATLNGTAVAVGRTIIALLEHGQREDGTIVLPECLAPFGAPRVLPAAP